MVRGELDCERHLSDTLRTQLRSRREGHLCVVAMAASMSVGDGGTRSRKSQSWPLRQTASRVRDAGRSNYRICRVEMSTTAGGSQQQRRA